MKNFAFKIFFLFAKPILVKLIDLINQLEKCYFISKKNKFCFLCRLDFLIYYFLKYVKVKNKYKNFYDF